jgi:quinol monooxygenase YgiN
MPVLVATIVPLPGHLDEVEAVLKDLIPLVHGEDGCEKYALHRGSDKLIFVEKWRDAEALAAHGKSDNMKALGPKLAGLLAGAPDIQVLEAVPVGDPGKGAV